MGQENQPEAGKVQGENNREGMRASTKWAIGVTAVWLGGVVAYVVCNWCTFLKMEPNAVGDFLAGTMSPLALFWLVAGYRQQGEELRLNTEALKAQLKELALQVEATKELGESAKKQAVIAEENHQLDKQKFEHETIEKREAYKKKISPVFDVKFNYKKQNKLVFRLFNNGGDAFDVVLDKGDFENGFLHGGKIKLKKDMEEELTLTSNREMVNYSRDFSVTCLDVDKFTHEFKYTVSGDKAGEITVIQNFDV